MDKIKEMELEKEHLNETREWIHEEIDRINAKNEALKTQISTLKKSARGSYSEELENSKLLFNIVSERLHNYGEAYHKPYFARIDFREYKRDRESFYIGKFGIGDIENGDEKVIDWRAPIADLYYSGTQGPTEYRAPIGIIEGDLSLKRKFLYKDEELVEIFDEGINDIILKNVGQQEENALIDDFLKITLEESIGSKLKDVVATIQKEQNEIIRYPKTYAVLVQGSAGSGKTTVALHRLAYLLYRYRENLEGKDILVLAPNKIFLDYISDVLPSLGVEDVRQETFEDFCLNILKIKGKLYTKDMKLRYILEESKDEEYKFIMGSAKVKGSLTFKTMMDRYIKLLEIEDGKIESIMVDDNVLVDAKEIRRLFLKDLVKFSVNARKSEIKRYLSLKLKDKIEAMLDNIDSQYDLEIVKIKRAEEDSKHRRGVLRGLYEERDNKKESAKKNSKKAFEDYFEKWKGLDAKELYMRFFLDEDMFSIASDNKIPKELSDYMREKIQENKEKGIIDSEDLAPMLYLKLKIEDIEDEVKFSHVMVDEVQDYSPFEIAIMSLISKGNSLTLVGDLGQGIYAYKGLKDWNNIIHGVFKDDMEYTMLTQSYRSTIEIINLANRVLKTQENSLTPAKPVLRHGDEPEIVEYSTYKDFADKVDKIVDKVHNAGKNSIAIIGKSKDQCKKISDNLKKHSNSSWSLIKESDDLINLENIIIPSYMTKGLEFDCSIVFNVSDEFYGESELDKKLLYVVLTRALHYEYIFYKNEVCSLLK
ncbi:RNA polymerase recycling motor HelD [Clostridium cadaveris]|uniref:RNA polymerase recycling motor HelD n=1 Tax=Clostridium cadaveris TaxID=1529 RepID=UPI000C0850F1|nr:RNA polymerase recycling motor HelD [Clostridium cadaveris]